MTKYKGYDIEKSETFPDYNISKDGKLCYCQPSIKCAKAAIDAYSQYWHEAEYRL